MAKVTGPAFSVDAHGELGGGICYTGCKSGHRVILTPKPGNPNSVSQAAHRTSFQSAKTAWKSLSGVSKTALNDEADAFHMTGYNLYLRRVLKGDIVLPSWHEESIERLVYAYSDDCEVSFTLDDMLIWDPVWPRVDAGYKGGGLYRNGSGMRWLNITAPQGATILSAHIHFHCQYDDVIDVCRTQFCGDNEDNAAIFTTALDYMARRGTDVGGADNSKRTVEEVNWDNIPHWGIGDILESPDLSAIVQEIVNRPGWQSGNALALFWDDHKGRSDAPALREAVSRNGSPVWCEILHVTFRWFG